MDDLLNEFLIETTENISILDAQLMRLEQDPNDPELLGNIFRLVHTIKGTCGFLGLPRLESVAHAAENVLAKFRDGEASVSSGAVTLILEGLDRVRVIVSELERNEAEPKGDDTALIAALNRLADSGDAAAAPLAKRPSMMTAVLSLEEEAPAPAESLWQRLGGLSSVDAVIDVFYAKVMADRRLRPLYADTVLDVVKGHQRDYLSEICGGPDRCHADDPRLGHPQLGAPGLEDGHFQVLEDHFRAAMRELDIDAATGDELMALLGSKRTQIIAQAAAPAEPTPAAPAAAIEPWVAAQTIRVNVTLLESLMTVVSELVLTRNQLMQILRGRDGDCEFAAPLQRLNHVTTELQEGVMKTRMQPIGKAWAKLPRIVRDLSLELGKKVVLRMLGADTELDRHVLELIRDPLTHMVRNSVDHGIETPTERRAAGKRDTGTITLNAYHEGGHIIIEISDDGRGLNLGKIKAKAIKNRLVSEAELEGLSDQQIQQYVFKPGFSTTERISTVSGRGVGLDVVRANIERIGGTVESKSKPRNGSKFVIKIPLTLAIVSALLVESAGERFAIPQINVLELVRASSTSEPSIEFINKTPVLRLRNRLLPLVSLRELLRLDAPAAAGDRMEHRFIVVTQVGNDTFGIIVDRVFDCEEIVVKPVAPILRDISLFGGTTILGDGCVIMILDPNGIAAAGGKVPMREAEAADRTAGNDAQHDDKTALLLFKAGEETVKAVPLALVTRLEEFERDAIEVTDGRPVVQYRGGLMPLVTPGLTQEMRRHGRQPVLVFSDNERSMGLLVDEIVDIVDEKLHVQLASDTPGIMGSAIIAGKATELIDAGHFLTQAFGDRFIRAADTDGKSPPRRVLIVDDSPFFRNLLTPLLQASGYEVTSVESADKALKLCEAGVDFDVIVSDIDMPEMSGFEFAEAVRGGGRWRDKPLVALSSMTTPETLDRGREVGFTDYVAKSDRDALLRTLAQTVAAAGDAA